MKPTNKLVIAFNQSVSNQHTYLVMLGVCTALATTSSVSAALTLGLVLWVALMVTNPLLTFVKRWTNEDNKLIVYVLVIATIVSLLAMLLETYVPFGHGLLGIYLPLIAVNCIFITRIEVVAAQESASITFVDAFGTGLSYALFLLSLGFIRELFGTGSILFHDLSSGRVLFELAILPNEFTIPLLTQPIGAFLTIGLYLGAINAVWKRGQR
jgi:Na+-translocating ferredoxin:NAD+ oxidoreductase subunit E